MKVTKSRIFLITDNTAISNLIDKSFKTFGYSVRKSESMKHIIEDMREYNPDILIMDTDINNFDCDEMCNILNTDEDIGKIPVILLTHTDMIATIEKHLITCIYDYIYKPVDADELHSRVRIVLATRDKIEAMLKDERENYVKATATTMHHEINQPLSVILLSAELLETKMSSSVGNKERAYVKKIKDSVSAVSDILYRLDLVAGEEYKPEIIDYADAEIMLKLPKSDFRNKVLVVDDIDNVRDSISEILVNEGIDTLSAENLKNGMSILTMEHQNIGTVFCDMRIGKRSGMELYHKAMKLDNSINFVIITGYPIDKKTKRIIRELKIPVIQKPFTRRRILSALKNQKAR